MRRRLSVLVACEMSGRVRDAFAARGWDAWSCDLLPSETPDHYHPSGGSAGHIAADVLDVQFWGVPGIGTVEWDLVIAHPPCDHLSLAGARWWKQKQADGRQQRAAEFFMRMTEWDAPYWAIENPVGIMKKLYRPPDQVVEPFWFGDPFAKKTCLWHNGALPELFPDDVVIPTGRITTGGGSWRTDKAAQRQAMSAHEDSEGRVNRAKVRSRTMPGFARALASQWGAYIEERESA